MMSPRTPTVWMCKSRRGAMAAQSSLVAEQSPMRALKEFEEPRGLARRAADGSVRERGRPPSRVPCDRAGLLRDRLDSG